MIVVRAKAYRTFGWAVLGLVGVAILADFVVGGLLAGIAEWFAQLSGVQSAADWLGIPLSLGELDEFEPRDVLLAAFYGTIGAALTVYGIRDLMLPRKVLVADQDGLTVHLGGWFGRPTHIPWRSIDDVRPGRLEHLDAVSPALMVTVTSLDGLPLDPWGAGWVDEYTLAINAKHWTKSPTEVAEEVAEIALRLGTII